MTEHEKVKLNEEMLVLAGFTLKELTYDRGIKGMGWCFPGGDRVLRIKDDVGIRFVDDLTACFHPEWGFVKDDWKVTFFERTNEGTIVCWIDRFENGDSPLKIPYRYVGIGANYPLSLCEAANNLRKRIHA